MKYIFQLVKLISLYNFLFVLALINIFFSTESSASKAFTINDVELSTPFENNFNKNKIVDEGFIQAYNQLILSILQSKDQTKIIKTPLNQIKGMIETFSIKEEKFINEIYYLNLSVSFNKKNVFKILEEKNIFPSMPIKQNIIFIPIIIDENKSEIKMFSENPLFNSWNSEKNQYDLLNYIIPTEDLEDFNLVKKNIKNIEKFDFTTIVNKYNLNNYIIAIIFKNNEQIKLLNKMNLNDEITINQIKLNKHNFDNKIEMNKLIKKLKISYEDYWKSKNEINTSVKLSLNISIENTNNIKISKFEEKLSNIDLIYKFNIYKFDNKNNFYKIIFNGKPDKFLEVMSYQNYNFEIKNKIWVLNDKS